jgi:hypothetical protein
MVLAPTPFLASCTSRPSTKPPLSDDAPSMDTQRINPCPVSLPCLVGPETGQSRSRRPWHRPCSSQEGALPICRKTSRNSSVQTSSRLIKRIAGRVKRFGKERKGKGVAVEKSAPMSFQLQPRSPALCRDSKSLVPSDCELIAIDHEPACPARSSSVPDVDYKR